MTIMLFLLSIVTCIHALELTELVSSGTQLKGIAGIRTSATGNRAVICNLVDGNVLEIKLANGNVATTIIPATTIIDNTEYSGLCDDLAYNNDFTKLSLTRISFGEVTEYPLDGSGDPKKLNTEINNQTVVRFVNPVAYDSNGHVFVANGFGFFGISNSVYNVSGPTPIGYSLNPTSLFLNGFDFYNNKLYAPGNDGTVLEITLLANLTTTYNVIMSNLDRAISVRVNDNGLLVVLDRHTGDVWKKDLITNNNPELIATLEGNLDNFDFKKNENKIVVTANHNRIWEVKLEKGKVKTLLNSPVTCPGGIALDPDDNSKLYVADRFALVILNAFTGEVLERHLGSSNPLLTGNVQFVFETNVDDEYVYVTDENVGRFVVLNKTNLNTVVETFGFLFGPFGPETLQQPTAVVKYDTSSFLVTQPPTNAIWRIWKDPFTTLEQREIYLENLTHPVGMVRNDTELFFTTYGDSSCTGGLYKHTFSTENTVLIKDELCFPEGLAVKSNGNVYVAEVGNARIVEIEPDGYLSVVLANLEISTEQSDVSPFTSQIPLRSFTGLTLNNDETLLYFSKDLNECGVDMIIL